MACRYTLNVVGKDAQEWTLGSEELPALPPVSATLERSRPNPLNPATSIGFMLAAPGHIRLEVLDTRGRLVRVLLDGFMDAGRHECLWNGRGSPGRPAPSGVYFCRLFDGKRSSTRKMLLLN